MSILQVKTGRTVRLIDIKAEGSLHARLCALGFLPGVAISILDTQTDGIIVVEIKGSRLMLGRELAGCLSVG